MFLLSSVVCCLSTSLLFSGASPHLSTLHFTYFYFCCRPSLLLAGLICTFSRHFYALMSRQQHRRLRLCCRLFNCTLVKFRFSFAHFSACLCVCVCVYLIYLCLCLHALAYFLRVFAFDFTRLLCYFHALGTLSSVGFCAVCC